jgi:hypothetical protein
MRNKNLGNIDYISVNLFPFSEMYLGELHSVY